MKTFVILYLIMGGAVNPPQKVAWFESLDKCEAVRAYANEHQSWKYVYSKMYFNCVEYPYTADGWYK